ncbi:GNAT family N-acetyltransferase [Streptomyces sp. NPDC056930]|uniref:GNAT family N-acetyltransferase n=1 Tax=Streptomyces sp. NPDC056930 TaxID=3345967 RepID=UPI003624C878
MDGITEIGGIGTLPILRRQGFGAAVTTALTTHARDHGVLTFFLAYAEEVVPCIYGRLGLRARSTSPASADAGYAAAPRA